MQDNGCQSEGCLCAAVGSHIFCDYHLSICTVPGCGKERKYPSGRTHCADHDEKLCCKYSPEVQFCNNYRLPGAYVRCAEHCEFKHVCSMCGDRQVTSAFDIEQGICLNCRDPKQKVVIVYQCFKCDSRFIMDGGDRE